VHVVRLVAFVFAYALPLSLLMLGSFEIAPFRSSFVFDLNPSFQALTLTLIQILTLIKTLTL
jgi:hypothetical protein